MTKQIHIDFCSFSAEQKSVHDRKSLITQRKVQILQLRQKVLTRLMSRPIFAEEVVRTTFGKPYLKDDLSFHFNYSHSQQHFALASSFSMRDLGVDIEDLNRQVRFDALAQHAFHPDEYRNWKALNEDQEYWFKVWTTKEAVLKASGLGIRINLNSLNTHVHADAIGGMCEHTQIGSFGYQHYVVDNTMLTVAWRAAQSCRGFQFPQITLQHHPVLD